MREQGHPKGSPGGNAMQNSPPRVRTYNKEYNTQTQTGIPPPPYIDNSNNNSKHQKGIPVVIGCSGDFDNNDNNYNNSNNNIGLQQSQQRHMKAQQQRRRASLNFDQHCRPNPLINSPPPPSIEL